MRIGQSLPPVAVPATTAAPIAQVMTTPAGLSAPFDGGLAGIVIAGGDEQTAIATDKGVFVLRGPIGLSPGTQVILTSESGDGSIVRLHRAPASVQSTPEVAIVVRSAADDGTLDFASSPAPVDLVGHRLPARILASDAATTATSADSLPLCGEIQIRVLAIMVPTDAIGPKTMSTGSARTFQAVVAARHADGWVVRSDDGPTLVLPPNVELGEGTRITYRFEPTPAAIDASPAEMPVDVIDALMRVLSGGNLAARASIVRLLPRPDKALPLLAAAFLGALKNGDVRAWLGAASERFACGRAPFHDRLSDAWMNAGTSEAQTKGEWQSWAIPLLTGDGVTPLRVYRRQSEKRDANGEGDAQAMQRVIFDCTFSRVGRVQVDTLCRRPRRCDMLIRTASPLEPSVRDAVSLAFAETAAIIDLAGRLDFHTAQGAFVELGTATPTPGRVSVRI
ncbi:MAG: hypothetical protein U1E42_12835 [Rhodospirillales bacterium]